MRSSSDDGEGDSDVAGRVIWPLAWFGTSAALVLLGAQVESGAVVAVGYVVLNAAAVLEQWLARRTLRSLFMTRFGWAAAAQLPVVLWLILGQTRPRRLMDTVAAEESAARLAQYRRRDRSA